MLSTFFSLTSSAAATAQNARKFGACAHLASELTSVLVIHERGLEVAPDFEEAAVADGHGFSKPRAFLMILRNWAPLAHDGSRGTAASVRQAQRASTDVDYLVGRVGHPHRAVCAFN
jgi:hypothetical protein